MEAIASILQIMGVSVFLHTIGDDIHEDLRNVMHVIDLGVDMV